LLDAVGLGDRMEFDPEIVVRLAWDGVPIVNVPTRVRYFPGGLSNFRMVRDNALIVRAYTRLVLARLLGRRRQPRSGPRAAHAGDGRLGLRCGARLDPGHALRRLVLPRAGTPLLSALDPAGRPLLLRHRPEGTARLPPLSPQAVRAARRPGGARQ